MEIVTDGYLNLSQILSVSQARFHCFVAIII